MWWGVLLLFIYLYVFDLPDVAMYLRLTVCMGIKGLQYLTVRVLVQYGNRLHQF